MRVSCIGIVLNALLCAAVPHGYNPPPPNCGDHGPAYLDNQVSPARLYQNLVDIRSRTNGRPHVSPDRAFGSPSANQVSEWVYSRLDSPNYTRYTQQYSDTALRYKLATPFKVGTTTYEAFKMSAQFDATVTIIKGPRGHGFCPNLQVQFDDNPPNNRVLLVEHNRCNTNVPLGFASLILIYNDNWTDWTPETAPDPVPGSYIPVAYINRGVGIDLIRRINRGESTETKFITPTVQFPASGINVFAKSKGGDERRTIVLGAVLTTAPYTPGINEDGSGISLLLELFDIFKNYFPHNKILFAFWADNVNFHDASGAKYWGNHLTATQKNNIFMYLHFQGVSNGTYGVLDGDGSSGLPPGPPGSGPIETLFRDQYTHKGINNVVDVGYLTYNDFGEFVSFGKPVGGLYDLFGDILHPAFPCRTFRCDDLRNVDTHMLKINTQVAAQVLCNVANRNSI
ncbi:hypothetical protein TWF694_000130 [Orbilia ellipsospora]|uniref:Peptide hydrolase n=1 Tax=Orbilia ellipsospora TaxID=2528407 RepID=A0AAV9XR35_9PEZI